MATAASRLSSSRARGRLVLWLVAAAVLAALVVGYLVVDRGGGHPRRDAVAAYIRSSNTAQSGLLVRLGAINTAYSKLRLDPTLAADQAPALASAERAIAAARARVVALRPPADARVLHERTVRVLTLERDLARDVTALARHLALVTAGARELAAATARLSRDLRASPTGAAQAAAFDRYAATLAAAGTRLSARDVPVLLRRARRGDVARLERVSSLARELGRAIERQDPPAVSALLRRLEREVRIAAAVPGGRLLVAAYNARVGAIARARTAVDTELRRLDRTL